MRKWLLWAGIACMMAVSIPSVCFAEDDIIFLDPDGNPISDEEFWGTDETEADDVEDDDYDTDEDPDGSDSSVDWSQFMGDGTDYVWTSDELNSMPDVEERRLGEVAYFIPDNWDNITDEKQFSNERAIEEEVWRSESQGAYVVLQYELKAPSYESMDETIARWTSLPGYYEMMDKEVTYHGYPGEEKVFLFSDDGVDTACMLSVRQTDVGIALLAYCKSPMDAMTDFDLKFATWFIDNMNPVAPLKTDEDKVEARQLRYKAGTYVGGASNSMPEGLYALYYDEEQILPTDNNPNAGGYKYPYVCIKADAFSSDPVFESAQFFGRGMIEVQKGQMIFMDGCWAVPLDADMTSFTMEGMYLVGTDVLAGNVMIQPMETRSGYKKWEESVNESWYAVLDSPMQTEYEQIPITGIQELKLQDGQFLYLYGCTFSHPETVQVPADQKKVAAAESEAESESGFEETELETEAMSEEITPAETE